MNPPYSRRAPAALIVSADALGAALLGAALELHGYRAVFPQAGESGADALRRLKPRMVLLEPAEAMAADGGVMGRGMMTGAQLVLFGRQDDVRDLQVIAARYQAAVLVLPADAERLAEILHGAPGAERLPRR